MCLGYDAVLLCVRFSFSRRKTMVSIIPSPSSPTNFPQTNVCPSNHHHGDPLRTAHHGGGVGSADDSQPSSSCWLGLSSQTILLLLESVLPVTFSNNDVVVDHNDIDPLEPSQE